MQAFLNEEEETNTPAVSNKINMLYTVMQFLSVKNDCAGALTANPPLFIYVMYQQLQTLSFFLFLVLPQERRLCSEQTFLFLFQ